MNIVIVGTCEYTFVVTHWIHSMLVTCYVLVHRNDMVINTYKIQQIHVTFYLVSTYKWPGCYSYMIIALDAYLHVTGSQIMMVCLICMLRLLHDVCAICTISSYELGTILCLIVTVNMEFYFIEIISSEFISWHLLYGYSLRFFAFLLTSHFWVSFHVHCPHISCVCLLHKFAVILQFATVSSSWTGK